MRNVPSFWILLLLLAPACGELTEHEEEQVRSTLQDSLLATTESWDIDMQLMEKGQRRVVLQGQYAIDYTEGSEEGETHIQGPVYIQIYDSTGTLESEAWSQRAIYRQNAREFELFDSVRVETTSDRHLLSSYLHWFEESGQIRSDRHVTIITPSDSISGSGFEGKSDLSSYTITDPRGRVIVD